MTKIIEFGEKFSIVWQNTGVSQVGEVRNYTLDGNGYRPIPILLDDVQMNKIKMRFLVSTLNDNGPKIVVSADFMKIPVRLREAGIWHEVGHIVYEHLLSDEFLDQSQLKASRQMAIKKGIVLPMELEADCFAILQSGKESIIESLTYLMNTRSPDKKLELNELGKRELEIRITAIRTRKCTRRRTQTRVKII